MAYRRGIWELKNECEILIRQSGVMWKTVMMFTILFNDIALGVHVV
jgi:hypothetical protein